MYGWLFISLFVLLLSCSISSGALESPGLLLSYSLITIPLHITIILIITLTSFCSTIPYIHISKSTDTHTHTHTGTMDLRTFPLSLATLALEHAFQLMRSKRMEIFTLSVIIGDVATTATTTTNTNTNT